MAAENPDMAAEKGLIDRAYTKSLILPDIMRLVQNTHPEVSLSVNFGSAFRLILRYLDNPGQIAAFIDCHLDDTIKDLHGLLNTSGDQHVKDVSCLGSERALEMVKKIHELFTLEHDPVVGGPAFFVSFDKKNNVGHYVDLYQGKPTPAPCSPETLKEKIKKLRYECDPVLYMTKEVMQELEIASKDKGSAERAPKRHKSVSLAREPLQSTRYDWLFVIPEEEAKSMVVKPPTYLDSQESGGKVRLGGLWVKVDDTSRCVLCQDCADKGHFHKEHKTMQQATDDIIRTVLNPDIDGVLVVDETLWNAVSKFIDRMA